MVTMLSLARAYVTSLDERGWLGDGGDCDGDVVAVAGATEGVGAGVGVVERGGVSEWQAGD